MKLAANSSAPTLASTLATAAAIALLTACDSSGGSTRTQTNPGTSTPVNACEEPPAEFTIELPLLAWPPDHEGQGWIRPPVWPIAAFSDSITVPNGRPIYALFVTGYESNRYLDELFFYNFARHLMARGAYVHYAWWNNLLAPYMERPLHHPAQTPSQSYPGNLDYDLPNFLFASSADDKALPGEDYQFVADAERFLSAIREHNPGAMIIVVGHSMGGGAIVNLASQTDVVMDILAPIDPANNRNYPWAGPLFGGIPNVTQAAPFFNFTRWRVTRDTFLGFRARGLLCLPYGPWKSSVAETLFPFVPIPTPPACAVFGPYYHDAPPLYFGSNVINLYHRYQHEAIFPNDFEAEYWFGHHTPPGSITPYMAPGATPPAGLVAPQASVAMRDEGADDPGGWPGPLPLGPQGSPCCLPSGQPWHPMVEGIGWPHDGHGEIIGYRGPTTTQISYPVRPVALGTRVRTSPQCGDCPNPDPWPSRELSGGQWFDPVENQSERRMLLMELENRPFTSGQDDWEHRPANADLCRVSQGLIDLFDQMNRPPHAFAGDDRSVECAGQGGVEVVLDGSGSSDPDSDPLTYSWSWPSGSATGQTTTATLPLGSHCITLTVEDPSGHLGVDTVSVTVQDTTPPNLAVALTPDVLSPPSNMMVDIQATVDAEDLCGEVVDLTLVEITGNGINPTQDIAGAEFGTLDLSFQLRAALSGGATRVYRVKYQATDASGNRRATSASVTVPGPLR